MMILPAIDINGGKCVRLYQGEFDSAQRVADDAVETAKAFCNCGATWVHMVDLDGAREGGTPNRDIFVNVAKNSGLYVELGGGIRDMETIDNYLASGISRVILGSAEIKSSELVREAVKEYGDKIAVGIDARNGYVAVEGWLKTSTIYYVDFAKTMEDIGVRYIIFTDISKDGTLNGPNLEQLRNLHKSVNCDIIASGGIRDIENIKDLKQDGFYGAICGKALYSGTLDLSQAIRKAGNQYVG